MGERARETIRLFFQLLWKEVLVSLEDSKKKWIQASLSILTMFVIFDYIMPNMGLDKNYALFFVIGLVASFGLYEMVGKIAALITDLNGDRAFSYLLTLPLHPIFSISSFVLGWSLFGIFMTLLLFPIAKLLLFSRWDLSQISLLKFLGMNVTINVFFGYFSLWLASLIKDVKNTAWLWVMIINPLYTLGGYYSPWRVTKNFSSLLAFAELFNPITYVMEGIRATLLEPNEFLSFWVCLAALWIFIPLFCWDSYRRLKKRLDFV
jgi:ABC-2 type transport system permease protein